MATNRYPRKVNTVEVGAVLTRSKIIVNIKLTCVLDVMSTLKYGTSTHKAHTVLLSESTAYFFGRLKYGMETFFWSLLYFIILLGRTVRFSNQKISMKFSDLNFQIVYVQRVVK